MNKKLQKSIVLFLILCLGSVLVTGCGDHAAASKTETKETSVEVSSPEVEQEEQGEASVVCFTSDISADGLVKLYEALGWTPTGNVAVKNSTGEPPASNYLRPELIGELVQMLDGTIVECNTAYGGSQRPSESRACGRTGLPPS